MKPASTIKESPSNTIGTAHTYVSGQTGHVDLLDVFEQPTTHDSAEEETAVSEAEDFYAVSQGHGPAGDFSEADWLGAPKTPATQGEKQASVRYELETTPVLPKNPFGNRPLNLGATMDLSQVFKATQAPSSPVTNAFTSDGISERPSPDMFHQQRPATADPVSSPVDKTRSILMRAVTEPHAVYVSMKQSQEERERLRVEDALKYRNEGADKDQSDDGFESQNSALRRRLQRKKIEADARDILVGVKAASRPAPDRRGRGRGRGRLDRHAQSSPIIRRSGRARPEAVLISDDIAAEDAESNTTEDETEHEEEIAAAPPNCRVLLEEDNKENFDVAGIQVPMTTSKATGRDLTGPTAQSSPTTYRSRQISPVHASGLLVDNQLHENGNIPKPDSRLDRSQPFAIVDSQPSQSHNDTCVRFSRATDSTSGIPSSPNSRAVILQSQGDHSHSGSLHLTSPKLLQPLQRPVSSDHVMPSDSYIFNQENGERRTPSSASLKETDSIPKVDNKSDQLPNGKCRSLLALTGKEDVTKEFVKPTRLMPETYVHANKVPPRRKSLTVEEPAHVLTSRVHHDGIGSESVSHVPTPDTRFDVYSVLETGSSNTRSRVEKLEHMTQSFGNVGSGQVKSRTPTPRSRSVPSEFIAQGSATSSLFETAHTHVNLSHSNGQPLRRTSWDPEIVRMRKLSQINPNTLQAIEVEDIDLNINLLDDTGIEVQAALAEPSSIEPSKKRRRGHGGGVIHLAEVVPAAALPDPLYSTQDREHDGQQAALAARRYAQDGARLRLETSLPLKSTSKPCPSAPNRTNRLSITPPKPSPNLATAKPSKSISTKLQDVAPTKPLEESASARRTSMDASDPAKPNPSEKPFFAPNRVFAHFNGRSAAYYPATCLGVLGGEEPRFKVRFDDGTMDVINAYGVKRLELRQGDTVKLNLDGARTKNYVVVELKDKQRAPILTPSRKAQVKTSSAALDPITDMYGYTSVVAELKQQEVPGIERRRGPRITASLRDVYMTQTMWTGLKDRPYTYLQSQSRINSGLLTPSERPSTPSTPSSRNRRNKKAGLANLRQSTSSTKDVSHLFENMAFGISNISEDTNRDRITKDILSNGGWILKSGFDELFNLPAFGPASPKENGTGHDSESRLRLKPSAESLGFTCLLADRYCRSHKFVQALAAGIPCLATRWVQDCAKKERLLPWEPYLLPAGESEYLGGAVKSRVLQSFSTQTARLATIISNRPNFLEGQSVLLIMSKSEEDTMSAHPFITHALGASKVSRAHSLDAAAKAVAEAQTNGEPWDWVYSHKKEEETENYLFGVAGAGKKRKRGRPSGGSDVACEKGKTRVVGNNFVIQSLILGQLIDDD